MLLFQITALFYLNDHFKTTMVNFQPYKKDVSV